ncbi:MAG TPA: ferritin-like domain-containing protein, partial [Myxococcota bacterium]|nr:ferritin-like domain-containing protein [Myxococcota bacterium]
AAGRPPPPRAPRSDVWDPAFFGLDRTTAWRGATPVQRAEILSLAGRGLLEEAWYVEQCGVAYASTMALRATNTEERALYALFSADEARHLFAIEGWLADAPIGPPSPFHHLLVSVLEQASTLGAVLVVQVLLEGWGLRHYRDLAVACNETALTSILDGIVQDETRHHGSGVILLSQRALDPADQPAVIGLLSHFLTMVRAGPQGTLSAIDQVLGPLTRGDRVTTLRELDTERHAASRLAVLHSLLQQRHAAPVREALEGLGMFTPLTAEQAA